MMICYRDMTFCDFKDCSGFSECHRAMTDKVVLEAKKWWGSEDFPIARFMNKPDCYGEKE